MRESGPEEMRSGESQSSMKQVERKSPRTPWERDSAAGKHLLMGLKAVFVRVCDVIPSSTGLHDPQLKT